MYNRQAPKFQLAEPRWRPSAELRPRQLPAALRDDLLDSGSLTARLIARSRGQFQVRILAQRWSLPYLSERRLLAMGEREWGLVREVLLCGGGQPWVFARSVMPARSLTGDLRRLRRLDARPLGHLLFTYPGMTRSGYQLCRTPASLLAADIAGGDSTELWGRRSRFDLAGRPIMVSEIFLPAFGHSQGA